MPPSPGSSSPVVADALRRPSALLVMPHEMVDHVYGSEERARLDRLVCWAGPDATVEQVSRRQPLLHEVRAADAVLRA